MLKFGFLGFGQAGGKIVDALLAQHEDYQGIVVNTAINDLAALERVSEGHRIALQGSEFGGGRTPEVAYEAMLRPENGPEIAETARRVFAECDFIWLVAGLGGGTGTGAIQAIVEYATQLFEQPVGVIVTLPRDVDGLVQKSNAMRSVVAIDKCVEEKTIGAVLLLDNERFFGAFAAEKRAGDWRELANQRLASTLHEINVLTTVAGKDNFDRADFLRQLRTPGFLLLGKGRLGGRGHEDVFRVVRNTIEKGHLSAGYLLEETQLFTICFRLRPEMMDLKSAEAEHYLAQHLSATFPAAIDRFTGYYETDDDVSVVYSVLAGLGAPERVFAIGQEVQDAKVESSQRRVSFQTSPSAVAAVQVTKVSTTDKPNPFLRGNQPAGNKSPAKANPFLRG